MTHNCQAAPLFLVRLQIVKFHAPNQFTSWQETKTLKIKDNT